MSRRGGWGATVGAAVAAVAAVSLAAPAAVPAAATSPAQRLVDTYAPIVVVRAQRDPPCDDQEEQYRPTTVDVALGNPRVRLIAPRRAGPRPPPKYAPTAADLARLLSVGYHIDLPGDPLKSGCTYARDFAALERAGRAPAIAYAHIVRQPGETGLVVQYWFYYWFNQFNDVHEGDWEGMQIVFDANTPARALAEGPTEIGLFQHGGGERADWSDDKLSKRGTHSVAYAAVGSHATFYESAVYVGNGQGGSGLGCDNTTGPSRELRVRPVLVPTRPALGSRYQWLRFQGRWGQREASYNNGPTGPNTKQQWLRPFDTQDSLRSASPKLPGGALLGPTVTNAFCGTAAAVSSYINLAAGTPLGAVLLAVGLILLIVVPVVLTRWRPVELDPLRRRRAVGQLLRAALRLYRRNWRTLLTIGLVTVPIIAAVDGLRWVAEQIGRDAAHGSSGLHLDLSGTVTSIGAPIAQAVVAGAVVAFVRELERGRVAGVVTSYRALLSRFGAAAFGPLLATLGAVLLAITIIGIPIAIRKIVDWQFVQQEVLLEGRSLRQAFRGSTRLVRGHWWHTLGAIGFLWLLSVMAGPVLGFALIFTTLPLSAVNLFGSLVFALLIPFVALGRTLLYLDLAAARAEEPEPAPWWGRWRRRRARDAPGRPAPQASG